MPGMTTRTRKSNGNKVEGEGSYSATRNYNRHLASALSDERSIRSGAERARRAVEGPEAAALRVAERKAKAGPRPTGKRARVR